MDSTWPHYLATGILLGISAGLAPGPLLALVISETLRHDARAGVRVAFAPLLTDLPVILVTWVILSRLAGLDAVLGLISLAGGAFVFSMGYESLRVRGLEVRSLAIPSRSLTKGVLANVLSPHPYLFWFSVGGPIIREAADSNPVSPWLFLLSFYLLLIGSKVLLAVLAGRSRSYLSGSLYRGIMRLLGLLLMVLAGALVYDGLRRLGLGGG
ncbi:LysE family transporter, partial [Imhoffiella purpurea]|uniref:LysE family transporter n=1 Tax=Imhoffiella purpurea TaxID=1249627 RepID=UPI000B93C1B3